MNRIFISYAKEDSATAQRLYKDLRDQDLNPWLDIEDLTPGVRWKNAIRKAIEGCGYFIALLSSRSVGKRGFVQKEIRQALETLDTVPEDQIFIVPVRLDECRPGNPVLQDLHWLDLFPLYEKGFDRLLRAVGGATSRTVAQAPAHDSESSASSEVAAGPRESKPETSAFRVLVVASNPADMARIRVDQEAREIFDALNGASRDRPFEVKYVLSARPSDLRRQLLEHNPQLLHVASHGHSSGGVVLEDSAGRSRIVGMRTMKSLIHLFRESLECIVLNATFSEKMAESLSEDIDYVVGMSGTLSDEASLQFSASFYETLAAGKSVEFAYSSACAALSLEQPGSENLPILFHREERGPGEEDLSIAIQSIARSFLEAAELGAASIVHATLEDIAEEAKTSADDTLAAVQDLEMRGYLETVENHGPRTVQPTLHLFLDFAAEAMGWNPREDARSVLQELLKSKESRSRIRELAGRRDWDPPRVNTALLYLQNQDVIETDGVDLPFAFRSVSSNSRSIPFLRGFIEGRN